MLFAVRARQAIRDFLAYPNVKEHAIPVRLRSWIRQISELCPDVSYTTRALAIHCLTTNCGNTLCIYHHYHDKACTINDTTPPRTHKVTGVPYKRHAFGKGAQMSTVSLESINAIHCGCLADEALWDFWWWKTGLQYSPSLNIAEPWRNTRLDPRARGFMVQWVEKFTLLSIDDIYTGSPEFYKSRYAQLGKMEKQAHHARKVLKKEMERLAFGEDSG